MPPLRLHLDAAVSDPAEGLPGVQVAALARAEREPLMGYARKVDANQSEIVAALRKAGYLVKDLRKAGDGAPDLLVARHWTRRVALMEVKSRTGRPTAAQGKWAKDGWPVTTVRTIEEAFLAAELLLDDVR